MKWSSILVIVCLPFLSLAQEVEGDWKGALAVQGIELRIVFHLKYDADKSQYTATMDSPDQNAFGISCGDVTYEDSRLIIKVPSIGGTYDGKVEGEKAEGTWSQGAASLPLNLERSTEEEKPRERPQNPEAPFPYQAREVKIKSVGDVVLAGTLTIPDGQGPFPGVVLVSGSGPQDRDESLMGHKPFLVIADRFSRNGIAVLRYDDRGVAGSTGDFANATTADFAEDAAAALTWLKKQEEIRKDKSGIVGHSEGGLIAPIVAAKSDIADFIVLMAGPGYNGREILEQQTRLIAKAGGAGEKDIKKSLLFNDGAFRIVMSEQESESAALKLEEYIDAYISTLSESERSRPENNRETLMAGLQRINTPWFRYFLSHEPANTLQDVSCPVLAINGENDLQVPSEPNLQAISEALKKGGNTQFETKEFPELNHLFQPSKTGAPSEYASIDITFSEEVLAYMGEWINSL